MYDPDHDPAILEAERVIHALDATIIWRDEPWWFVPLFVLGSVLGLMVMLALVWVLDQRLGFNLADHPWLLGSLFVPMAILVPLGIFLEHRLYPTFGASREG